MIYIGTLLADLVVVGGAALSGMVLGIAGASGHTMLSSDSSMALEGRSTPPRTHLGRSTRAAVRGIAALGLALTTVISANAASFEDGVGAEGRGDSGGRLRLSRGRRAW